MITRTLILIAIAVAPRSWARDWGDRPGRCFKHCTKYEYDRPSDVSEKQRLKTIRKDAWTTYGIHKIQLDKARRDYTAREASRNQAEFALSSFKSENAAKLGSGAKILAAIADLQRGRSLYEAQLSLVSRLIVASTPDFSESLALLLERLDASKGSAALEICPSFAREPESCQILKDLLDIVASEIAHWSEIGVDYTTIGPVTPALMLYASARSANSEGFDEVAGRLSHAILSKEQALSRARSEQAELLALGQRLETLNADLTVKDQEWEKARTVRQQIEASTLTTQAHYEKCKKNHEEYKIRRDVGENCEMFCP
jgi:hypothetical protein